MGSIERIVEVLLGNPGLREQEEKEESHIFLLFLGQLPGVSFQMSKID